MPDFRCDFRHHYQNHLEVLEAGQAAATRMGDLLARVLRDV